jgi:hypothetical protein
MRKLRDVSGSVDRRRFVSFIYSIYGGNPSFKDMQVQIVRQFLRGDDSFIRQCLVRPVLVESDGLIEAECMYVRHPGLPALQVAFFEALEGKDEAVGLLLEEARRECRRLGLERIVIGLNGHVSYGVGFLADSFDEPVSFDCLYSAPWYPGYFEKAGFDKAGLTTYAFRMENIKFDPLTIARLERTIEFRNMDMRKFKEEILLMGRLCNECLKETRWYFDRDPVALYQLIGGMRPMLRPENLIFAMHRGREIGFMFWHPNYNELMPGGRRNSLLSLFLRYILFGKRIKGLKLNAIGILPQYRRTGVLIGLVHRTHLAAAGRFETGETNFVWDDNKDSRLINSRMTDTELRHYRAYETTASTAGKR